MVVGLVTSPVTGLVTELVIGPVAGLVAGLVAGVGISAVDSWMCGEFALTGLVAFSNKDLCGACVSCGARGARGCLRWVVAGVVCGEGVFCNTPCKNSALNLYRHA